MKDRDGNEVTGKEALQRFKAGVQAITPMQQMKINLFGMILVIAGLFIGLFATWQTKVWWLFIILIGSLFVQLMGLLGMVQKYFQLKMQELLLEQMKGGNINNVIQQ